MGQIQLEQRGTVMLATLHNPPHGLMDEGTVADLDSLVERADADESIRAVVFTGSHPDRFVAHYDVGEILAGVKSSPAVSRDVAARLLRMVRGTQKLPGIRRILRGTPLAGLAALIHLHEILLRMNRSDVVYLAAINGSTMGGGCELSLACDRRIMARGDFVIGQPEVLLGFPPGAGGTQRLARLLGTGKALRIALDGLPLDADEALDIGLVDELVDQKQLLDTALKQAERLGRRPPAAIGAVKRAVYEGGSRPFHEGLMFEAAEFLAAAGTEQTKLLMQRYADELDKLGDVPGYDRERLRQFADTGSFPE